MSDTIKVGMADMNICSPPNLITTLGLGSCVGVVIYEPNSKWCGLVHIMLPGSKKIKNNENGAKFADTGIELLVTQLEQKGAKRRSFVAKIAGGSQMFAFSSNNELLRVGQRNVDAVIEKLTQMRIPLLAQDTGANYGRTIEFNPMNGELLIKAVGKEPKII